MNLQMQDMLMKVDRTQGVVASVQNRVAGSAGAGSDATTTRSAPVYSRVGGTFAQVLNKSVLKKGAGETAATAGGANTGGKTFAELLNHQQLAADDAAVESSPKAGESEIAFLNRRHASGVNGKKIAGASSSQAAASGAATTGGTTNPAVERAKRAGASANQILNLQKETDPAADKHAEAEKGAEGLISNALILPILKQIRRSPFGENSVFSGGNGEKAFGPEFDMQLADRIAQSPRLGVREALVQRLESRSAPATSPSNPGLRTAANGIHQASHASRIDVNG
ncbi:MAG TPA: hypothetical protein VM008_18735 [Phycisphaerae bacterium]|nr:hypothetical protein [Phycisphaerae bacterium]